MTSVIRYSDREWVLVEYNPALFLWTALTRALESEFKIVDWSEYLGEVESLFLGGLLLNITWDKKKLLKEVVLCSYALNIPVSKVKNLIRIYRIKLSASQLKVVTSAWQLVDFFDTHQKVLARLNGAQQWNFLLDQTGIQ